MLSCLYISVEAHAYGYRPQPQPVRQAAYSVRRPSTYSYIRPAARGVAPQQPAVKYASFATIPAAKSRNAPRWQEMALTATWAKKWINYLERGTWGGPWDAGRIRAPSRGSWRGQWKRIAGQSPCPAEPAASRIACDGCWWTGPCTCTPPPTR